jgi:hypothetical protein
MIENSIVQTLHIDEQGLKDVKVVNIAQLMKDGVEDPATFLKGLLDAENSEEFSESDSDYIKGFKYGKTGKY